MSKSHHKELHPHHKDLLQSLLQSIFCLSVYLFGFCFLKQSFQGGLKQIM